MVVKGLGDVLRYYRLHEFIVGFAFIAIATSVPELAVGILSALDGIPALSFGDIIGSNVVNISLVLGTVAVVGRGVKVESQIVRREFYLVSLLAMLPILLFLDGHLSRVDGTMLLLAFGAYLYTLIKERKRFRRVVNKVTRSKMSRGMLSFVIGMIILLLSAKSVVRSAEFLLVDLGLPAILIGLVFVSIGTSLPELAFQTHSVREGFSSLALGDLMGSIVTNATLILGIVSLLHPVEAHFLSFGAGSLWLLAVLALFILFGKTKHKISRLEGALLFIFYLGFLMLTWFIGATLLD